MLALEVFMIYVTPFLILGAVFRVIMKRHAVDQSGLTATGLSLRQLRPHK
jgi:hypothetical protein